MRWKNPKLGYQGPWERVFVLVPTEIGDEWFWFERVYRREVTIRKKNRNGVNYVDFAYEYASPDVVLDALKDTPKGGMNIDA